jgi:hypothetical protein
MNQNSSTGFLQTVMEIRYFLDNKTPFRRLKDGNLSTGIASGRLVTRPSELHTVELRSSGLIGVAIHPDMQKIRIIGFFFEKSLHGQFEVETNF